MEEVKKEFEKFNMDEYNEVVFCGFGEPTERIDDLIEIAKFVKEKYHKKIRINTIMLIPFYFVTIYNKKTCNNCKS